MSFTHYMTFKHQKGSDVLEATVTLTSGAEENISESIAGLASEQLVAFTCDYSQLKALYIYSASALTIKTNSSGAPDQTLAIAAGIPYAWAYESGITCPITTDITALYVSNAGASATTLEIRTLEDPTV